MKQALCIGINDYPGTESDLNYCVNDAEDMAKILTSRDYQVKILIDGLATRNNIETEIIRLVDTSENFFITYSGHGSYVPDLSGDEADGVDECLCPHDVMSQGVIIDDWLHEVFSRMKQNQKGVMMSDSCHSGTLTKFMPPLKLILGQNIDSRKVLKLSRSFGLVKFLSPSVFLPRKEIEKIRVNYHRGKPPGRESILLMAGCQEHEYSYDGSPEMPNGAYTYYAKQTYPLLPPRSTYYLWHHQIRGFLPSTIYPQTPNLFGTWRMKRSIVMD